jgi:D-aminoacyl-tRNA deacylase
MRIIAQNVTQASVKIDDKLYSEIGPGYLILVSFTNGDNEEICDKIAKKLINLRVFPDETGKTNLSIKDIGGSILSVSQFTLYADIKNGNRPSFINNCLNPKQATLLYDYFNDLLKTYGLVIKTGVFGADMKVSLINDGPFTTILDSEELFK